MPSNLSSFSLQERLLVAPLPPGSKQQFLHARMESTMTLTKDGRHSVTPFPRGALDLLNNHNATRVLVQVGTSSSHSFGHQPLDSHSTAGLDLGPSGVRVQATLAITDPSQAQSHWEALLHELVAERIVLAPLFSVSIRRLHRHWISWRDDGASTHFELVLPMEGAALSSEGMHAFSTTFSPCYNQSGIFQWNSPAVMSEFFLKRQSAARHSWWILMEQQEQTSTTTITKGMQFQPHIAKRDNQTVSLTDVFPDSLHQRNCPFAEKTTLDTVVSPQVPVTLTHPEQTRENYVHSKNLSPDDWKEPWMTILPMEESKQTSQPHWSVHQTLQRPRGVAYSGRLITQVQVHSNPSDCPVSVELQWFLPPIVQPTWQSFQIILEDQQQQTERRLDWRHDLQGTITAIDPQTGRSTSNLPFDEGSLHFQIPQWNFTSGQTLTISLDYRPAFLSFEHFPGDANRGVEIPPARATFVDHCNANPPIPLYSNSLLLLPPVPDMSMPFNVLSMTCSLYAFVIGSLLNLLIRKSSERVQGTYDPSKIPPPSKLKVLVGKVKEKVVALKGKLKGRKVQESSIAEGTDSAEEKDASAEANDGDPDETKKES